MRVEDLERAGTLGGMSLLGSDSAQAWALMHTLLVITSVQPTHA